jgi:hypothetical protein
MLRRIADECAYGVKKQNGKRNRTDAEVRGALGAPSLSALITQRRLGLLSSILWSLSAMLPALLATEVQHGAIKKLPWATTVFEDLRTLQGYHGDRHAALGDPYENATACFRFISAHPGDYKKFVKQYLPTSTAADEVISHKARDGAHASDGQF